MKRTIGLCIFTFGALLLLQGCAVNVITAPHGKFQVSTSDHWQQHSDAVQAACTAAIDAAVEEAGLTPDELNSAEARRQLARLEYKCNEKLGNTL